LRRAAGGKCAASRRLPQKILFYPLQFHYKEERGLSKGGCAGQKRRPAIWAGPRRNPAGILSRAMKILGIETSCDETAAAVVERRRDGSGVILANIVRSQIAEHAIYGGVVPEIAARAHVDILDILVRQALAQAGLALADMDAIAATAGPGLIGGLLVGVTEAKMLALAAGKPFLPINHLEGHALTARLTNNVPYPYLLLLVSGGHTQLAAVLGPGRYKRLGTTIDDALGECFDKAAKLLGLPYPGGPAVEQAAKQGRAEAVALPRPLLGSKGCDFSFSGLKTAVRHAALAAREANAAQNTDGGPAGLTEQNIADICAGFQAAIADSVADRLRHAFTAYEALLAAEGLAAGENINADRASGPQAQSAPGGVARPRGGMGQSPIAVSENSAGSGDSEPQSGSQEQMPAAAYAARPRRRSEALAVGENCDDKGSRAGGPQAQGAPGGVARPRGGMGQSPIAASENSAGSGDSELQSGSQGQAPAAAYAARPRRRSEALAVSEKNTNVKTLVVSGGVAANKALRAALNAVCAECGYKFIAPPAEFCSDNAAMIAWAGAERLALLQSESAEAQAAELQRNLDFVPRPRWPLDMAAAAKLGSGRKGAKA